MGKLIAAINMTLDGYCDHTAVIADEELHLHFADLLKNAGIILYGRTTYQLMESYWPNVVDKPTGKKSIDNFAVVMDNIPKIVYSHTLKHTDWKNATIKNDLLAEDIETLKRQ